MSNMEGAHGLPRDSISFKNDLLQVIHIEYKQNILHETN